MKNEVIKGGVAKAAEDAKKAGDEVRGVSMVSRGHVRKKSGKEMDLVADGLLN